MKKASVLIILIIITLLSMPIVYSAPPTGTDSFSSISNQSIINPVGDYDYARKPKLCNISDVWIMTYQIDQMHGVQSGSKTHIRFSDDYGASWTADDVYLNGTAVPGFPIGRGDADFDTGNDFVPVATDYLYCPNGDYLIQIVWKNLSDSFQLSTTQRRCNDDLGFNWVKEGELSLSGSPYSLTYLATTHGFLRYGNTIYMAPWYRPNGVSDSTANGTLFKSTDNGTTWEYITNIKNTDTSEIALGYTDFLHNVTFTSVLQGYGYTDTYQCFSFDLGEDWTSAELISDEYGLLIGNPTIYNYSDEPNRLYLFSRLGPAGSEKTTVLYTDNKGANWLGQFEPDSTTYYDSGYADMLKRSDDIFYMLSYGSSDGGNSADIMEFIFRIDRGFKPSPYNGSVDVISKTISTQVHDPDGDSMTVYFYDASDDSLIGTDTGVSNGSIASVEWSSLVSDTQYSWYAIANDSTEETQSPIWSFETGDVDDIELISIDGNSNMSVIYNSTPTINFSVVANAVQYHLEIDNNADFSSPEINYTDINEINYPLNCNINSTRVSFILPSSLSSYQKYYMRVRPLVRN